MKRLNYTYRVDRIYVNKNDDIYGYLDEMSHSAKLMYNVALFIQRNWFTACNKRKENTPLHPNEEAVVEKVEMLDPQYRKGMVISKYAIDKLMVMTEDKDFYSLPSQIAQQIIGQANESFRAWLGALREYQKDPKKFNGRPKMPKYLEKDTFTFSIPSQTLKPHGDTLGFPKTRKTLKIRDRGLELKEVQVVPAGDEYKVIIIYKKPVEIPEPHEGNSASIDFGVNNTMSVVASNGKSVIFKGGAIKEKNQYFNKEKARLTSVITKGHEKKKATSHRLDRLSKSRHEFIHDAFQKMSSRLMEWCEKNDVTTLVIGYSKGWKQESSIGKTNNQNFCSIPFLSLLSMIEYKAMEKGINVIIQEESYTSKADFLSSDHIPTIGDDDATNAVFSGCRIHRGSYRSKNGICVNADLMAAANILRKAGMDTSGITEKTLRETMVIGYRDLNTKIKQIA